MSKSISATVKRIAILNSYLQGGHINIAESESTLRFIEAGKNLGIEVEVFAKSEDISDFEPDFVVAITYQEGKLTRYPTYVSMNIAPSLIKNVPRFIRNILSCDGFLTISTSVKDWLQELCLTHNKAPIIGHAAFSLPKTTFKTFDFQKAKVMYVGTNWDGMRHKDLFRQLSSGDYLKCYGPEKSWSEYPGKLYGGTIPFDGISLLETYQQHGAGLCIGLSIFDEEGIASSRMFEIAAASALPLCVPNPLIKASYGDSVLYLNNHKSTVDLANQIIASVEWMQNNPAQAQEMAASAHAIFNDNLSMEYFIQEMVKLHKKVMTANGFIAAPASDHRSNACVNEKLPIVTYLVQAKNINYKIITLLNDVFEQSYPYIKIVILTNARFEVFEHYLKSFGFSLSSILFIKYRDLQDNKILFSHLNNIDTSLFGILNINNKMFPNHTQLLVNNYLEQSKLSSAAKLAGNYSGSLDFSDNYVLDEIMPMEHYLYTENKVRIGYASLAPAISFHAMLMKFAFFSSEFFGTIDFYNPSLDEITNYLTKIGFLRAVQEVSTAVNVDYVIAAQRTTEISQQLSKILELQQELYYVKSDLNSIVISKSWILAKRIKKIAKTLKLMQ